jgi:hypothetical protein
MSEIPAQVFVELNFHTVSLELPAPLKIAFKDLVDRNGAIFYLPWPIELIPCHGAEINFDSDLELEKIKVGKVDYEYSRSGVTVCIRTRDVYHLTLKTLFKLAEYGAYTKTLTSLEEILAGENLPTTWEGWVAWYRPPH